MLKPNQPGTGTLIVCNLVYKYPVNTVFQILNIQNETNRKQTKRRFSCFSFPRKCPCSVDVVKPVNNVEEGEHGGEDHPRPLIDRVYVSQVGDGDFELGRAPP